MDAADLPVEELLVVRDGLLLVHAQHASEHARSLGLEDINNVAVRPPVQSEVFDQSVFWGFHLSATEERGREREIKTILFAVDVGTLRVQRNFFTPPSSGLAFTRDFEVDRTRRW